MLGRRKRTDEGDSDEPKVGTPRHLCIVCGFVYDEALGDPDSGIAPGTSWADVPADWRCPVCGVRKSDFEPFHG